MVDDCDPCDLKTVLLVLRENASKTVWIGGSLPATAEWAFLDLWPWAAERIFGEAALDDGAFVVFADNALQGQSIP